MSIGLTSGCLDHRLASSLKLVSRDSRESLKSQPHEEGFSEDGEVFPRGGSRIVGREGGCGTSEALRGAGVHSTWSGIGASPLLD